MALPAGPIYDAYPTAYLGAENARPKVIWDTVLVHSPRPVRLTYVRDSAHLDRRNDSDAVVRSAVSDELVGKKGASLGDWKADFANSGYVTFRVRVEHLPEPLRDPRYTRGIGKAVEYAPPVDTGAAREPTHDGDPSDRYRCDEAACHGAPYAVLNAYENHPLLLDEADFARGQVGLGYGDVGRDVYKTVALVRPGDRLRLRIALDNGGDPDAIGAPPLEKLIAREVRVSVVLPRGSFNNDRIMVYVTASNTSPQTIVDSLPVRSSNPVRLQYRPNTAAIFRESGGELGPKPFESRASNGAAMWDVYVGNIPPSFSKVVYVEAGLDVKGVR